MSANRLLNLTFLLMGLGIIAELLLLGHIEDYRQTIPLVMIVLALLTWLWLNLTKTNIHKLFNFILCMCAISGIVGSWFHINANFEFALELNSSASYWELMKKSMHGAFPALAPFAMIIFALIGYTNSISILKQSK